MRQLFRSILMLSLLPLLLLGAAGCGTPKPVRPYGNLGDSINSSADEFAPMLRPGKPALYFTSNRKVTEDIWRVGVSDPAETAPRFSPAAIDTSDISLLSQPSTNDGSVVFTTLNGGFFASSHAPDTAFARAKGRFGGVVGGTDLFEFVIGEQGIEVQNLGLPINSLFWDSHPAAARRGDSLLLIFSSDRPTTGTGFGSPYQDARTVGVSGDTMTGNSDLYYVFRIGGRWSEVRNFVLAEGAASVNSRFNDYSPFIYCIDERPRMFFSSNRAGSYDIWEAELAVDFTRGSISVLDLARLPMGADSINTPADEMFPVLTPAARPGEGQYLYLASNRNVVDCEICADVASVGGFDLYRFPFIRDCRPPQVTYEVVVLDAENPERPVRDPIVRLHRLFGGEKRDAEPESRPEAESRSNPARFEVDYAGEYALFGGSNYNELRCEEAARGFENYVYVRVRELEPEVRKRVVTRWLDTIEGARRVVVFDTVVTIDTVPVSSATSITSTPGSVIQSINTIGDRLIITRLVITRRELQEGGTPRKYRAQVTEYDTVPRRDTIMLPTTQSLAPSERVRRFGSIALPGVRSDIVIRDTVYIHLNRRPLPPCEWIYTRSIADEYRRNVPYFQTAFWEVNTTENLRRDLKFLTSPQGAGAGFVELHPDNLHFGAATGRRQERVDDYTRFAGTVDRNLEQMASEIAERIIPEFLDYDIKNPSGSNRLVIQIGAYSDMRPISRGYYFGEEKVEYVAGRYDTTSGMLDLYPVSIRPGASLVSANNDTLSKLRAYFGYRELLERLRRHPLFEKLVADGTILLPYPGITVDGFRQGIEKAKILVVMEGRYIDASERPSQSGYGGGGDDFYSLDDVRRMDLTINRLEWINGRLLKSPCCSDEVRKLK